MLHINEAWVDATRNLRIGESDVFESCYSTPSEVYRGAMREHGRCIGKVYVDRGGSVLHVGWVFQKRVKYDDCDETFLRETWVTIHSAQDTVTRHVNYVPIERI